MRERQPCHNVEHLGALTEALQEQVVCVTLTLTLHSPQLRRGGTEGREGYSLCKKEKLRKIGYEENIFVVGGGDC